MRPSLCILAFTLTLALAGCISMEDPAATELRARAVPLTEFAGAYHTNAIRYSRMKGDAATSRSIAFYLRGFTSAHVDEVSVESFEIEVSEGLAVTVFSEGSKAQRIEFVEGRDYTFEQGVIRFADKQSSKVLPEVAVHAAVTKTMSWMSDDQGHLVVAFGGHIVGTALYLIPFGVRGAGFAVFERKPNPLAK